MASLVIFPQKDGSGISDLAKEILKAVASCRDGLLLVEQSDRNGLTAQTCNKNFGLNLIEFRDQIEIALRNNSEVLTAIDKLNERGLINSKNGGSSYKITDDGYKYVDGCT